jgi:hypothetical protein
VLERLTLLLRIREIPSRNPGPDFGYPEVSRGFLLSLQANSDTVP